MSINSCSAGGESFGGEFFRNPLDGKVYLGGPVASCREASVIAQVTGLESTRRLPTVTFEFHARASTPRRRACWQSGPSEAAAKSLAIARIKQARRPDAPPGYLPLDERAPVARWSFDPRHAAESAWTYDDRNLYLCVRGVTDDSPMVNGGNDVRTLFKTGDAIEFELRTQPDNDDKQVIEGDLRLLVSVFEKKPVAVLYRYKVPGTSKAGRRSPLRSAPRGSTGWKCSPTAQIAIDRGPASYTVRAAVPLAALHFAPAAGKTYRGDIGVVYSDKTGTIDELRMYWANPTSGMVNDLPTEAQIDPDHLGPVHHRGADAMTRTDVSGGRWRASDLLLCFLARRRLASRRRPARQRSPAGSGRARACPHAPPVSAPPSPVPRHRYGRQRRRFWRR